MQTAYRSLERAAVVDARCATPDDPPMAADDGSGRGPEDLDAREAARIRRRDREAAAEARALMQPGMGKVFKQIQDAQAKAAKEPPKRRKRARG
jgi:hypothetical protein